MLLAPGSRKVISWLALRTPSSISAKKLMVTFVHADDLSWESIRNEATAAVEAGWLLMRR